MRWQILIRARTRNTPIQGTSDRGRPRKLPAEQIIRVIAGEQPFDVRFDRHRQTHNLIEVEKHLAAVDIKLRKQAHQLWQDRSDEEQAAAVAEYKEFLKQTNRQFDGKLQMQETEYFLFCSDLPPAEAQLSIQYLTAMYVKLSELFGVMPGENIWRGKCVVVVFRAESDFHAFERGVMRNANPEGTAGLHHGFRNGKSIISCKRGTDPAFYRLVLIHETVHDFLHRYKSSVSIPSWINEGIADLVADFVVPDSNEVTRRRTRARAELLKTRSLGEEFFGAAHITAGQYGIASDMSDMMVKSDPTAYRLFLDEIKEGVPWEQSLADIYGLTSAQLAEAYFQQRVLTNR